MSDELGIPPGEIVVVDDGGLADKIWDAVDWCRARGAEEFTLAVVSNELGDGKALHSRLAGLLAGFERPAEPRWGGHFLEWDPPDRPVPLWRLEPESVAALRRALAEVEDAAPWRSATDDAESTRRFFDESNAWVNSIGLYRDGRLMFEATASFDPWAVFCLVTGEKDGLRELGIVST